MSSYLNFYLVPKKKGDKEIDPFLLFSYSSNSNIYQMYKDNLNPKFIVDKNGTRQYSELTEEDAQYVLNATKKDLENIKTKLLNKVNAYKELTNLSEDNISNYVADYISTKEYIEALEINIHELQFIVNIVTDTHLGYTDFEKILINID